jgi:hypothetical protein
LQIRASFWDKIEADFQFAMDNLPETLVLTLVIVNK